MFLMSAYLLTSTVTAIVKNEDNTLLSRSTAVKIEVKNA